MKRRLWFLLVALCVFVANGFSQNQLNEYFEGLTFPSEDWSTVHVSGSSKWLRGSENTGNQVAYCQYASQGAENYLITPQLHPASGESLQFSQYGPDAANYGSYTTFTIEVSTTTPEISEFTVLETIPVDSAWTQKSVDLSQYAGQNIYIAFHVVDADGTTVLLDSVRGVSLPAVSCPKPTDIAFSDITLTSATLSWTGSATGYNLQYVAYDPARDNSVDWANATSVSLTENSYDMTNLENHTTYAIRLQSVCNSEEGDWTNALNTINTLCNSTLSASDMPWFESFEQGDGCWTVLQGGPSVAFGENAAKSGSRLLMVPDTGCIIASPEIIGDIHNFRIQFSYNGYSPYSQYIGMYFTPSPLIVGVTNGDSTTFIPLDTLQYNMSANYITTDRISLNRDQITGTTGYHLAFASFDGGYFFHYIDDLTIEAIPECLELETVEVSNPTRTSATVTWEASDVATSYNVHYKTVDEEEYSVVTVEGNTMTFSDENITLLSGTHYLVYVTLNCGSEQSLPSGVTEFITGCSSLPLPIVENFESTPNGQMPDCWSRHLSYVSESEINPSVLEYPSVAYEGSKSLYLSSDNDYQGGITGYALSPAISNDIHTAKMTLFVNSYNGKGRVEIGVMSDPNDTNTFELVKTILPSDLAGTNQYGRFSVRFNNTVMSGTDKYIAIRNWITADEEYDMWLIDNVEITVASDCEAPEWNSVTASDVTANSVTIGWTDNDQTHTSWAVHYKNTNQEEYTTQTSATNPVTISGLTAGASYEFYVTTVCGAESESEGSEPITVLLPQSNIAQIPYTTDFEQGENSDNSNWTLINTEGNNLWYIGTPALTVRGEGTINNSLFISNDNGQTASYDTLTASTAIAMRTVQSPAASNLLLEFDMVVGGEYNAQRDIYGQTTYTPYDQVRMYLVPLSASVNIAEPATMSNYIIYDDGFGYGDTILHVKRNVTNPAINQTANLLIVWTNNDNQAYYTFESLSVDIDNLSIKPSASVTTLDATDVTASAATLNGSYQDNGVTIINKGFMVGSEIDSWSQMSYYDVATDGNDFSYQLTGLRQETRYGFMAFVVTSEMDTIYGSDLYFTTESSSFNVTTLPATDITASSAILNGQITGEVDMSSIEEVGFEYKAVTGTSWTTVTIEPEDYNAISQLVENLEENTEYEYHIYIVTSDGITEGNNETFTTTLLGLSGINNAVSVSLYPNPASDKAVLSVSNLEKDAQVVVTDVQGRVVLSENLNANSGKMTISTENLENGVYYVRIISEGTIRTEKLIKQ